MKKSEILKLKPGRYLVTDRFCNYTYVLTKYEGESTIVCSISQRGALSYNSVGLHYGLIKDFDDEYDRCVPRKRIDTSISIGGLHVHKAGAYDIYNRLHIVALYNENTFKKDLVNFSLHHKINMSRYDKKTFKILR